MLHREYTRGLQHGMVYTAMGSGLTDRHVHRAQFIDTTFMLGPLKFTQVSRHCIAYLHCTGA